MVSKRSRLVLLFTLVAALGWRGASEGKTNVWGQRWDIPYEHNTVGAHLGVWPTKGLDLYVQWVTPQILAEGHVPVDDKATLKRIALLLDNYIVVRVVAVNQRADLSHPFDYDAWKLLLGGQEHRPVVLTGEEPTAAGGYFVGSIPSHSTLSGWLFFSSEESGLQTAQIIYDFGYQRVSFSFPPLLRR